MIIKSGIYNNTKMTAKYIKYVIIGLLGIFLAGCTPENDLQSTRMPDSKIKIVGDQVILTTSLEVPEFRQVTTRAFQESPSLKDLRLYLIEFVDNGSPIINTLSKIYTATKETAADDNSVVNYKVTLTATAEPRILHMVAVAYDDLEIPYGTEATVMPNLVAAGLDENGEGEGTDAYWRRFEFPDGYCYTKREDNTETWEPTKELKDNLIGKNVKLVRNFAKVTVGMDPALAPLEDELTTDKKLIQTSTRSDAFKLESFYIVNTPRKGTMAPYSVSNKEFPNFFDDNGSPMSYDDVAANYSGISPGGTLLGNQITSEDGPIMPTEGLTPLISSTDNKTWDCLPARYIYERPFNSINHTYIIIKGTHYNKTNANPQSTYYKLDLGKANLGDVKDGADGIFRYYGLLRNFNYFIRIKKVETDGYATPSAAAEGTVYNNISFDINTDHLINMSNGTDIVRVNLTTAVITSKDSVLQFRYAYKHDILDENKYDSSKASLIDLKPGNVISKVEFGKEYPWEIVNIYCKEPTYITETQEFTVVNTNNGLGRTITLVSHNKWDFENLCEFARIWENYPDTYQGVETYNPDNPSEKNPHMSYGDGNRNPNGAKNSTYQSIAGTDAGSQFTIFFDIPDNIPEALFPLEFTIESDHQGLENEPMGTIVVSPGPTLFPDQNGPGEKRIQYVKSVTWTEYNTPLRTDVRDDNGTFIENTDGGPNTHRVRCRFRTIETVTEGTVITVRIANINFNTGEVKFTRTTDANNLRGPGLTGTPQTN